MCQVSPQGWFEPTIEVGQKPSCGRVKIITCSDDTPSLPTVSMTSEFTARITNLKPMTYYKVAIRGVVDTNLGPSATIR